MVIVIYKEGDDCINSTSEYLAKVLNQLPTVTEKETSPVKETNKTDTDSKLCGISQHIVNNVSVPTSRRHHNNHLSASAKSFVSRKNGGLNIPFNLQNLQALQPNLNPFLSNLEYLQKLQNWPFLTGNSGYDPLAAQLLQNYLVVQELQRFETQRLALQSHLLKMHNLQRWSRKHHSNGHNHRQHSQPSSQGPTKGLQVTV